MRPRRLRFPVSVLTALFLGAAALAAEQVQVKRALDGDSLLLADGRQVRMIGVNAPELGKDGAPDQPLAAVARALVARHTEGRRVTLTSDAEGLDRHSRVLAYVTTSDGRDLQELLLHEGLAWFVAVAPNLARVAQYRAAEGAARASRRGIWGHGAYRPKPVEQLTPRDGGFQLVAGTVRRVRAGRDVSYFELGPGLDLLITRADWIYFSDRPIDWVGRRVLARGWVSAYKGSLRMRISHPSMLEIQP